MRSDETTLPPGGPSENPLAAVLADTIRDLADVRGDLNATTDALVKAVTGARWWAAFAQSAQDFNCWVIDTVCRARLQHYCPPLNPNTPEGRAAMQKERVDLIARWHDELARRDHFRRGCAA
jgi:hypothetical protein